jgi:arylsulfatase A-like enzyme
MPDRLNVLLAVIAGARADHLSCAGYGRETTPFLDRVARDGVRFATMIAAAPDTLSAHASLVTGLHAVTHGATEEHRVLSARHRLLPEYAKAAGYRTAAFCVSPHVSPDTGCGRGFDAFVTQRHHNRLAARALHYGRTAGDRLLRRTDAGARRTNDALKRWLASSPQPFFAFVHYNDAHLPLDPPPPYQRLFLPRGVPPARVRALNQDGERCAARDVEMTAEDFDILTALYDGALRYVDTRLREVADFLQARGEWDRTLLVVAGDHGVQLGEHGMIGGGCSLSEALLRVPLLLRCPPCLPQGFVVDELASAIDVVPTILALLGLAQDREPLQGRALIDAGRATPAPAFAIAERFRPNLATLQRRFPTCDTRPFDVRQKAIRTRRDKFVWRSDEANELYDLRSDPGETRNLIEREPVRAAALRRQLFDWLAAVDKFEGGEDAAPSGDRLRQEFSAMGYPE